MKKKLKPILLALLVLGVAGASYGIYLYFMPKRDVEKEEAQIVIDAKALMAEFEANDTAAKNKYWEKLVQIDGEVHKTSTDSLTTVFIDYQGDYIINLQLLEKFKDEGSALKKGDKVTLKGKFVGHSEPDEFFGPGDIKFNGGSIISDEE